MTSTIKQHAQTVIDILKKKYPAPECALHHHGPWQLLVATILSAQCTDKRVNMVTPDLFRKYADVSDFAAASLTMLEKDIHSTGFYRNKAKNIIACAQALLQNHGGQVPQTLAQLVKLPGVGRKTASVILGTAFGKAEGIVVDTHVTRLSQRLGFTGREDAVKIEQDLMKIIKKKYWIEFSHLLILHGRERCNARKPDCANCELLHVCPFPLSASKT
jgi:endonuclease-3